MRISELVQYIKVNNHRAAPRSKPVEAAKIRLFLQRGEKYFHDILAKYLGHLYNNGVCCDNASQILALILAKHFNIAIGGETTPRLEIHSWTFKKVLDECPPLELYKEIEVIHQNLKLIMPSGKLYLIDPTAGQINGEFDGRIWFSDFARGISSLRLSEARDAFDLEIPPLFQEIYIRAVVEYSNR